MSITPASSTTSTNKRKLLKRPDEFESSVGGFFNWVEKNARLFIVGIGVALVLLVAVTVFIQLRESKEEGARVALFTVRQTFENEEKPFQPMPAPPAPETKGAKAKPAAPTPGKPHVNAETDYPATIKGLQEVVGKHGGTQAAFEAQMMLAQLYVEGKQNELALKAYETASTMAKSGFDRASAYSSWGYALENAGQLPTALEKFQKALDQGEALLKGDLLMSVARIHESQKDVEKAKAAYQRITSELPETSYARTATQKQSQL
ncbi:MAG: tetratricopeptide repeat protein [Bacteriovoracia bacterium]